MSNGTHGVGKAPNASPELTGTQTPPARPRMFYDGGCPLCRREVGHYRKVDRNGDVEWLDIHADPSVLDAYGIDREAAMERLHVMDPQGRIHSGARAFVTVWQALPGYRWLAKFVLALRLVPLMEAAYRPFARWRYRRRCTTGCTVRDSA